MFVDMQVNTTNTNHSVLVVLTMKNMLILLVNCLHNTNFLLVSSSDIMSVKKTVAYVNITVPAMWAVTRVDVLSVSI